MFYQPAVPLVKNQVPATACFAFVGKDEFLAGIYGTPQEAALNNVLRERYVYKRILENASDFNIGELDHAKNYYVEQLRKLLAKGGEIKPEYLVK